MCRAALIADELSAYNDSDMILSVEEETLVRIVRTLPPQEAEKVFMWAGHLADLAQGREVEWSDAWTDEDLADAAAASLRRFDDHERDEA